MLTIDDLINQTRRDLWALIENSQHTRYQADEALRLRRQLEELQRQLEANREANADIARQPGS